MKFSEVVAQTLTWLQRDGRVSYRALKREFDLDEEAKQQPVIYAWEDLHWADPSMLELLTLFLQQVPTTRLLVVFTYRPEFTPPWGAHSYLSQLTLSRLGRSHVEAMVEKVTDDKVLPTEIVQQIVSKTDGVPLFVEELTKTILESGSQGVWESKSNHRTLVQCETL